MNTRGKQRRRTEYHSSDGPRDGNMGTNLLQLKKHQSQNRLNIRAKKSSQDLTNNQNPPKHTGINPNFSFSKNSPETGSTKKRIKKGYIMLRKAKHKEPQKDSSKNIPTSEHKDLEKYKITEENNKLIEKMINRKRQSSVTEEMQGKLHSKMIILSQKKSRRNIMKKVMDNNNKRSFLNETHISANRSSTTDQKPVKSIGKRPRKLKSTQVLLSKEASRNSTKEIGSLKLSTLEAGFGTNTLKVPAEFKNSSDAGEKLRKLSQEEVIKNSDRLDNSEKQESEEKTVKSFKEEPSPKVQLGIADTWGEKNSEMNDT